MWQTTPQRRPPSAAGKDLLTIEKVFLCSELATAESSSIRGAKAQVHRAWQVGSRTATRVYKAFKDQLASPGEVNMSRKKRKGRPSSIEADWGTVTDSLQPSKRKTFRRWACAAGKSLTTVWRWAKVKGFARTSRWIKPKLSDQHKLNRIKYVLEQVQDLDADHPRFTNMFDRVHIDEKWFYLLANGTTIILGPDEELPARPVVQHKSHVPKAMFVSVIGRPNPNFNFDGLVCIESCTEVVEAKRKSKYRAAGDLTEVDASVTSEYYREMMETKLVPAIIEAMPWAGTGGRTLTIQHDGAPAHNGKGNDKHWPEMLKRLYPRRRIQIVTQPAQSPDLNINDLGFFNSLQSLADKTDPESLSQLLDSVEECYWEYDKQTLERVWQAQFNTYNCILKARGGNDFKQSHTGVSKRQRRGQLSEEVSANRADIVACRRLVGM